LGFSCILEAPEWPVLELVGDKFGEAPPLNPPLMVVDQQFRAHMFNFRPLHCHTATLVKSFAVVFARWRQCASHLILVWSLGLALVCP